MNGFVISITNGQHTYVLSPGVAAFVGFAALANLARFESAAASALRTVSFSFNTEIGVCAAKVC